LNYSNILNLFSKWVLVSGYDVTEIISHTVARITIVEAGYSFFNIQRLETIIETILLFFSHFKKAYFLPNVFLHIETLFLKKSFLPFSIWKKLLSFLQLSFDSTSKSIRFSKATENDNLLTLFFYWFISFIFNLVFSFSSTEIDFLPTKLWSILFTKRFKLMSRWWNWEQLKCLAYPFIRHYKKQFRYGIATQNKTQHFKPLFFDFFFFLRNKQLNYMKWKKFLCAKKENFSRPTFEANGYFARIYSSLRLVLRTQVQWWVLFLRKWFRWIWFRWRVEYNKPKVIYDSLWVLYNKFWPELTFKNNFFAWLMTYGFIFRAGCTDFSLNWNFYVGYKGWLGFKWYKKTKLKMTIQWWIGEKIWWGFFMALKHNPLFSTFFSFVNWQYLLEYLLHFGHIQANYNTSFKDYITMIYNEWFILNILNIQVNFKWIFWLMFKMLYLGGFVCLVAPFNILLDGLITIFGAYAQQPYTWYKWVNGSFSNFDKIFRSIQWSIADGYGAWIFFSWTRARGLMWLWFCLRGLFQNLSVDISFFPSVYWSFWVFLESCAWFYPTITTSNTECFVPTSYLDYTLVSNDYSVLSLAFYINLLLVIFWWSKLMRLSEFSIYPQKLLWLTANYCLLPVKLNLHWYSIFWQMKVMYTLIWKNWAMFFVTTKNKLASTYKYLFLFWWHAINAARVQNFWRFHYFHRNSYIQLPSSLTNCH
jgi:hypothetical protein